MFHSSSREFTTPPPYTSNENGTTTHTLPPSPSLPVCEQPGTMFTVHSSHPLQILLSLILVTILLYNLPHLQALLRSPRPAGNRRQHLPHGLSRRLRPQPACVVGRARTFLMVFMGHSGSSAILSELTSHADVYVELAELVDHQPTFNTSLALQEAAAFFERGTRDGKTAGFKIRPRHVLAAPEQWRRLATRFDTRIIWQYRKNVVKSSVGEYSNRVLDDRSVVEGLRQNVSRDERCNIGVGCSFKIVDFEALFTILKGSLRSHRAIAEAVGVLAGGDGCVREVPYEDYLYAREEVMTDVIKFLGLDVRETTPSRFKATGDRLCEVVENWNQLCERLYGCLEWQSMLEDDFNDCHCAFPTNGTTKYCP